ncbi:MAG: hypothetical protein RLZ26_2611 [Pseudomonadota bacterium]
MRLRKIVIWALSSLSCALWRGRKNWTRKARSREKVAIIVQGSTTAFEKSRQVNAMAHAYILAPRSGITMNADGGRRPTCGLDKRRIVANAILSVRAITTLQAAEQLPDARPR